MKKIAIMYDFDKTLSNKDMQEYSLIPSLGYADNAKFWQEVTAFSKKHKMDPILSYMYWVLLKSQNGLAYDYLKNLGQDVEFFPGVIDWFERINAYGLACGYEIEHYIISSGMKEMIKGTCIAKHFRKIFACKYVYEDERAIWPGVCVNYTTKTQYIFRINKQVLDENDDESLNTYISLEQRPIPFSRMVYIGDGITDVPCMRLVKEYGGNSIVVYNKDKEKSQKIAKKLITEKRANFMCEANYEENSKIDKVVKMIIDKIHADEELENAQGFDQI
ncbi:MAG: haloacid dehalogenase-like hydrolase [Erysipelotrichaceae bacterium]|nr:haloacid dehalogenase-like hydrolase [Erysipelotrichaceae bacterium]MDY5252875.1 HAD family hydrolase [Erysipelotrichaceae bacterium]